MGAMEDSRINMKAWKVVVAEIENYTGVHALYQQSKQLGDHNICEQIVAYVLKNGFSFPGYIPRSITSLLPGALVHEVSKVNPGYYQQILQQNWPQQQYDFQPPQQQLQAYMQQQPGYYLLVQQPQTFIPVHAPQLLVPQPTYDLSKYNSLEGCNYYYDSSCGGIKKQEDLALPHFKGESSQGGMKISATGVTKEDSDDNEGINE